MNRKWLSVVFSFLAVIGAFMPIAGAGGLYANLHHLGGTAYLLYVLPFVLLGLSVVQIYKNIPHMKIWTGGVAVIGCLLTAVTTMSANAHVNAFLQSAAQFEEQSQQFQKNFDNAWNNFGNGEPGTGAQQDAAQKAPVAPKRVVPNASPSSGAILLGLGFISAVILSIGRTSAGTVTATIIAGMLLSTPALSDAAGKKPAKKAEQQLPLPDAPRPLDLSFGVTSAADALKILAAQQGTVSKSGRRIIKDDLSNPEVIGYFLRGVSVPGVTETRIWFMQDHLMQLEYHLSGSFQTYLDQLREKYGKPEYLREEMSDTEALWRFKDVEMLLRKTFMDGVKLSYVHVPLYQQAKTSDARVYQEATKEKAKNQKAF